MNDVDYIIIGQGLAGSVLAYSLMQQDQKILVIDEEKEFTSSKIAAGLCNPVVFKRLTRSWLIDEVLKPAKDFYQNQEQLLGDTFYIDIPIYKLFADEKEKDFWLQKSNEPDLFDWLSPEIEFPFEKDKIQYQTGAAHVQNSGFLRSEKWLNAFKNYLIDQDSFGAEKINYNDIQVNENGVTWKNYRAKKIIFCEGYQAINNPYFDWLPFKLTKGEVLTVDFEQLDLKQAINKGVFILPYGNYYKLGATYNWNELDELPTQEGRDELLNKTRKFIKDKINIIEHKAGVRPTVKDRRPLIGIHPKHSNLMIFNGLGTKGVMLAPYFANKLVHLILKKEPLPAEVDIDRFISKEA